MSDRDRGRHAELRAFFSPAGFCELQGILFAVASSPEEIAPRDWVPFVLDQLGRQRTGHAPGQRIAEGLTALYREIDDAVTAASVTLPTSCAFREDLLANLAEDAPVSRWCLGFLRAHSWLEQCWELVPAGEMRDELGALHLTLGFFASRPLAERMVSEFTGPASTLEGAATVFREAFDDAMRRYAVLGRSVRQAVLEAGPESRSIERARRNDPCPCGSGKKYKRCCMTATEDAMAHAARRVRRTQNEVEPQLARFLDNERGAVGADRVWAAFTCGREDLDRQGPISQLYGPWFLYDWREPGGAFSGAERFLDAHGARLGSGEKAFLRATAATPLSFHEVLEVERGRRLHVRDVLFGTEHQVYEQSGSEMLQIGDIIFARVVPYEGVALMIGCGDIPLRPADKLDVIRLREQIHDEHGSAPTREILLARADELRAFYLGLRDRLVHPTLPQMTNTDGDALEFHTITCDVSSTEEAFDALATLARGMTRSELLSEAEYDADGRLSKVDFSWLAKSDEERGATVLGNVVLEGGKLRAEVNSARRAGRLRKELTKRLGTAMRNLTVGIKPFAEAMEDFRRNDTPEARKKRLEEEAALRSKPEVQSTIRAIVERQWDSWVDEHVPALDGQTPRDAIRRPEGREKVEALLLDFERNAARSGREAYDFDRLRRKLGLRLRAPGPGAGL